MKGSFVERSDLG